jgi:hypothetical protein
MFKIDSKKNIYLTRGDIATINVTAKNSDGTDYEFKVDDVVKFIVFKKLACNYVVLEKEVTLTENANVVPISLSSSDTKIGDVLNRPVDYWYEVVLNPDTAPQTIIGYFDEPAIFRLLPEGGTE